MRRWSWFPANAGVERWSVRGVALLTGAMGLLNVLSALRPALMERWRYLEAWLPLEVHRNSRLTVTLAGFGLLLLSRYLWRRKRLAWWLTEILLVVSALTHLLKGLDVEEAAVAVLLAIVLALLRPHFYAHSDAPSIRQGIGVLGGALLFTLAYGTLGFYLLDRHFSIRFDWLPAVRQTVVMFAEFYDPGLEPLTGFGRYFADSIYAVGVATLGYAAFMLARPVLVRQPATAADYRRAQALVAAHGCSSLARFALFPDKAYFFSPGGSLVAYVVKGRVALALGDPIGPAADRVGALEAYQAWAARNDWQVAWYQTLPDYLDLYRQHGFEALAIGQEMVVDLQTFTLEGKAGKEFRTALNRLGRAGVSTAVSPPPQTDGFLAEMRSISDEWLRQQHGQELRFATGWFDDEYLRESVVVTTRDATGRLTAFANLVPEYQRNEVAVDLMRRQTSVEPGTMDALFVAMFQWAQTQGYASFSLGLSALAGVGVRAEDPAIDRALHSIYENVNRYYNFKGLHAFKEKFHPVPSMRYLIYPGSASLPAVALALMRANSGDEFWRAFVPRR